MSVADDDSCFITEDYTITGRPSFYLFDDWSFDKLARNVELSEVVHSSCEAVIVIGDAENFPTLTSNETVRMFRSLS